MGTLARYKKLYEVSNNISVTFRALTSFVTDGVSRCGGQFKTFSFIDFQGTQDTVYEHQVIYRPEVLLNCYLENGDAWNLPPIDISYIVADGNRIAFTIEGIHIDFVYTVDYGIKPNMSQIIVPMEDSGGVDIWLNALYSGKYQAGWFATFTIDEFEQSLISTSYQDFPNRYVFGSYSILYHDHVVLRGDIDSRKMFHPLRVFFPTLEPDGTVQDVNVWVPVPTWERATSIKWYLHPSVKGTCRAWWMKLLSGMDAYF